MSEYIISTDVHNREILKPYMREEIVRCRDCVYYKQDPDPIDPGWPMMCERTGDDMVEPYGFCAWEMKRDTEVACSGYQLSLDMPELDRMHAAEFWQRRDRCGGNHDS